MLTVIYKTQVLRKIIYQNDLPHVSQENGFSPV